MPHFIIHASSGAIDPTQEYAILKSVHDQAVSSKLFNENDIKVRLVPFEKSLVAGKQESGFVHVFGYIMGGRPTSEKRKLSEAIVKKLDDLLGLENIAMNVYDFEPATYYHRKMIDALN